MIFDWNEIITSSWRDEEIIRILTVLTTLITKQTPFMEMCMVNENKIEEIFVAPNWYYQLHSQFKQWFRLNFNHIQKTFYISQYFRLLYENQKSIYSTYDLKMSK